MKGLYYCIGTNTTQQKKLLLIRRKHKVTTLEGIAEVKGGQKLGRYCVLFYYTHCCCPAPSHCCICFLKDMLVSYFLLIRRELLVCKLVFQVHKAEAPMQKCQNTRAETKKCAGRTRTSEDDAQSVALAHAIVPPYKQTLVS